MQRYKLLTCGITLIAAFSLLRLSLGILPLRDDDNRRLKAAQANPG